MIFFHHRLYSLVAAQKILLPFMLAPSDGHHIPKSSFLLGHFSRFYYSEIFSENRMLMHIITQLSSSQLESLRIYKSIINIIILIYLLTYYLIES